MTLIAVLYAGALLVVTVYGLNQGWLAWRFARSGRMIPGPVPRPDSQNAEAGSSKGSSLPSVTVQIPIYNESMVADRVIAACARLAYPLDRLEIQVLDDSTDDTTQVAAQAVRYWKGQGVQILHLRRNHREGYKAGALAAGLRIARGELIAMFDADFLPPRDFLQNLVAHFQDSSVGFVQARWGHLNEHVGLLTRLQAFGLDAHFALEQTARTRSGYTAGFNGTAGIWRRACIDDAGGWSADTLTEDLDLSYRAQMRGWRMAYLPDVVVPAELPVEMSGFRAQQHRWTKGAAQTAVKLVGRVLGAPLRKAARLQGVLHLTATAAFPFMLILLLLHGPLSFGKVLGQGPGEMYFAMLGLGVFGFAGFFVSHLLAQRALHADWVRRLVDFPVFLAASVGMALNNTLAVMEVPLRRQTPFVRTPKYNSVDTSESTAWWRTGYASNRTTTVSLLEVVLAIYTTTWLALLIGAGAWSSVPFQLVFAAGTWLVVGLTMRDVSLARQGAALEQDVAATRMLETAPSGLRSLSANDAVPSRTHTSRP